MNLQQNPWLSNSIQPNYIHSMPGTVLQSLNGAADLSLQLGLSAPQISRSNNMQFTSLRLPQPTQQFDQLPKLPSTWQPLGFIIQPQQQLGDIAQQSRQNMVNQTLPSSQLRTQILQPRSLVQTSNIVQQHPLTQNHQSHRYISQNPQQLHQPQSMGQNQRQNLIQPHLPDQVNQQLQMPDSQIQIQLLQKLQQQQQLILAQQDLNPDPLLSKGMDGFGKDFHNDATSGGMLVNHENSKDAQQDLSPSMGSQSFGVQQMSQMTFDSIDSSINDIGFMNRGPCAPPLQFQRMLTYTRVYKRGAVGRSIDITRYVDYGALKQGLARMFGIKGQLEDRHRIGWKFVYVDHENDVLLLGDNPWEEFVNCVRYIRILSPQEVQQMSLDGDFGSGIPPNQACSSSDGGIA